MKFVFTVFSCFVFINSFAQMLQDPHDTLSYETIIYLKQVDSSTLPQTEKNKLEFEKIKQYITKRPKDGFYGQQFLWFSKYLDTASVDILINLFDTSIQKQYAEVFTFIKIQSRLLPGSIFPEMTLIDTSKQPLSVADLKGKVVLIDFWASWCKPCRAEMPKLISLYEKYKDKGFVVIAISLDEHKENWIKAIREDSLPWIHFCDLVNMDNNILCKKWGISSIPYNFLIDKDGFLADKEVSLDILEKELLSLLSAMAKTRAVGSKHFVKADFNPLIKNTTSL
ncbi:MAG: TlpA disulfide reductase family protein [Ginsengibacter sp.]